MANWLPKCLRTVTRIWSSEWEYIISTFSKYKNTVLSLLQSFNVNTEYWGPGAYTAFTKILASNKRDVIDLINVTMHIYSQNDAVQFGEFFWSILNQGSF